MFVTFINFLASAIILNHSALGFDPEVLYPFSTPTGMTIYANCQFMQFEWGLQYGCMLRDLFVEGKDYFVESAQTSHIVGKNQSDVEAIHIEDQNVKFLPTRIEGIYWNMVTFRVENSKLQYLDNIKLYKNLRFVHFDNNLVRELPTETFRETVALEWISMNDNLIRSLDKDIFKNMPELRVVSFSGNRIRSLSGELFAMNRNLESVNFNSNRISSVGSQLLKSLTKLQVINFDSNICVNDAFFNDHSAIEMLSQQFTKNCAGQCDNMMNLDAELASLREKKNIKCKDMIENSSERINTR